MLNINYIDKNLIKYRNDLYKYYGIDPVKIMFVPASHIYERAKVEFWVDWTLIGRNSKNGTQWSHVPTNIKAPHIFKDRQVIIKIMV